MNTSTQTKKKRVFIVDDHAVLREGLSGIINREKDLTVCGESENIANALPAIAECRPDIVIVDITLEDGSGLRLIENLKYYHPGLPALVLSMHDESLYAERSLKAGAKGYIMKQEPSKKFISAIRTILNGETYYSSTISSLLTSKLFSGHDKVPDASLSNRELELYQLIGQGMKKQAIAERLNLSPRTIENYMASIKRKMNFEDTHDIVVHAIQDTIKV